MNSKNENAATEKQVETCAFFVSRKRRYCKMLVGRGKRFCGQHLVADEKSTDQNKRIPCPLDPKHSCYENKLAAHLKICNARQKPAPPFYCKGINEGEDAVEVSSGRRQFQDLSDDQLMKLIAKVQKIFAENVGDIEIKIGSHNSLKDALARPEIGHSVIRHLAQNSSLLSLLEEKGLLSEQKGHKVFVEFGAGRGKLTGWIIEADKKKEESKFLLIDRGSQRYKVDAKLRHEENLNIKRLRIDIQDLDLSKVGGIEEKSTIVACGKHLCGAATDFSLRCVKNCGKGTIGGIVIALCCHHRCTWKAYTGKDFLKRCGFTADDFPVLVALTSWAVSGSRHTSEEEGNLHSTDEHILSNDNQNNMTSDKQILSSSDEHNRLPSTDSQNLLPEQTIEAEAVPIENRYIRMGLSVAFREEIGRKMKQILDRGRVEYLKQCTDLNPTLIQYVDQSSTLENIAFVAYKDR